MVLRKAMLGVLLVVAPLALAGCATRVETQVSYPPVADLQVDPEPPYPDTALEPTEAGRRAEEEWLAKTLIWGRNHHDRVQRICRWAVDLKLKVPVGYCG
jgi:hypothetical protein